MPVSAEQLFDWHEQPGAFLRLAPPWVTVRLEHFEGIRDGDRAVIRLGPEPGLRWVAEHFDYRAGEQFCDRQVRGPFSAWTHVHRVESDGPDASYLADDIHYRVPLGKLGETLGGSIARRQLDRQFAYRHRITDDDLRLHAQYNPAGRRLRVAVTGASGLIGSALTALLTTGGHEVLRLVRRAPVATDEVGWDPCTGEVEAARLEGLDAVIHLAGENVFALRWTEAKKARIYASRVDGTRLLAEALAGLDNPPRALLCASAVGYYGDRERERLTEDAPPSDAGFLPAVVRDWEAAAAPAADAGIRVVHHRIGVVLTPAGGALRLMLPAFLLGLGGRIGPPEQYFPWIVLDDVIGAFYHSLWTPSLEGAVNMTAPEPVTKATFTRTLAGILHRPAVLNVPSSVLATVSGQAAREMLLTSARVIPERLQQTGYTFRYPDLAAGLRHQLGRTDPPPVASATDTSSTVS